MTKSSPTGHCDGDTYSVERRRDSSSSKHHSKETTVALVPYIPRPISTTATSLHSKQRPMAPLLLLPPSSCSSGHRNEPVSASFTILSDVIPHILSYMDAMTLSRASSTCRSWNTLANSNELWNDLCKEKFGVLASELTPPPDPTRVLYVMSHLRMKEAFYGAAATPRRRENVQTISGVVFRRMNNMQTQVNGWMNDYQIWFNGAWIVEWLLLIYDENWITKCISLLSFRKTSNLNVTNATTMKACS